MKLKILYFLSINATTYTNCANLYDFLRTLTSNFNHFRQYTQSNCIFECQLKTATERCQCVAWDYPQIKPMPICDRFGRKCFTTIMTNASLGNTCECPLDCETSR